MKLSKVWIASAIIVLVIVIDQAIKIWVKTGMYWGEDIEIFSWFHIRFVQNNGMAFGMEFGSKLFLTLFRIVAVGVLGWIISRLCKSDIYPKGFVACVALIAAGAAGNIFDCVFYGEIFTNPYPPEIASFVPWGEGYGTIFHGLVVDMFYFPLFTFQWPEWMPFLSGKTFSFFDPVFNFADAAISVGMIVLLIFYSRYLGGTPGRSEEITER
jgi:signal peptidase II